MKIPVTLAYLLVLAFIVCPTSTLESQLAVDAQPPNAGTYVFVPNLDMYDGDIMSESVPTFDQAVSRIKQLINYNSSRCGIILNKGGRYEVHLKDPRRTRNIDSPNHGITTSVFYGDLY